MTDSVWAFKKAVRENNKIKVVPAATVVHVKKEYLRRTKFLFSVLPSRLRAEVKKLSAQRTSHVYCHTIARDNAAEGLFGNLKNQMRRQNLTGRRNSKRAHINLLAAASPLTAPGVETVLKALEFYRMAIQDKINPKKAFGKDADVKWPGDMTPY